MNKLEIVRAWRKDHTQAAVVHENPIRILPGYRLDFGTSEQLTLNFEGIEVRDCDPRFAVVMYRRFR